MFTDALEKIENPTVKEFLECHRNDNKNIKRKHFLSRKIRIERTHQGAKKLVQFAESIFPPQLPNASSKPNESMVPESDNSSFTSDYEPSERKDVKNSTAINKNIISPDMVSALDRSGISNQAALLMISATVNASGKDISEMSLSRSTIGRRRRKHRVEIVGNIQSTFDTGSSFVNVHYDEKKLENFTGGVNRQNMHVNRLAIVVSFDEGCKLLEIPKINNGSGATVAKAVYDAVQKWGLINKVQALSFDTTSSNTGLRNGSAFILERMMRRPILFFSCRHHVSELLLKKAFELTMEPESSGPNITIFNRFKTAWPGIEVEPKKIQANCAVNDTQIKKYFPQHFRDELVQFAYKQLETHHVRADYKDFAHMVLLFLGETPMNTKGIFKKVKIPCAISRARFMGMAIYSLKIYLFRDQFSLTGKLH